MRGGARRAGTSRAAERLVAPSSLGAGAVFGECVTQEGDPQLAGLGRTGLRNWLDVSAATTWDRLPEDQRARIASWLDRAGLDRDQQRVLAFHAGIKTPRDEGKRRPDEDAPAPAPAKSGRWLRLLRRS